MVVSLTLVLAVLAGVLYALKRWSVWLKPSRQDSWIQVVERHPLGPRQSLMVVRVRHELFLLAVSTQGVQMLSRLDPDEAPVSLEKEASPASAS